MNLNEADTESQSTDGLSAYRGQLLAELSDGLKPLVEPYVRRFYEEIVRSAKPFPPLPSVVVVSDIVADLRRKDVTEDEIDSVLEHLLPGDEPLLELDEATVREDAEQIADRLAAAWMQSFELLAEDRDGQRHLPLAAVDAAMLPQASACGPALAAVLQGRDLKSFDDWLAEDLDVLTAKDARDILARRREALAPGLGLPEEALEYLLLHGINVS